MSTFDFLKQFVIGRGSVMCIGVLTLIAVQQVSPKLFNEAMNEPSSPDLNKIKNLKKYLYISLFVTLYLHDAALKCTSPPFGEKTLQEKIDFLKNNVNLVDAIFWAYILPEYRLIYDLLPRLVAYVL